MCEWMVGALGIVAVGVVVVSIGLAAFVAIGIVGTNWWYLRKEVGE